MKVKAKDILKFFNTLNIDCDIAGNKEISVSGFCPLNSIQDSCVTWTRNIKKIPIHELNTHKNIILLAENETKINNVLFSVIYVDDVHRSFFLMLEHFFGSLNPEHRERKIEKSAIVETEQIGKNVYIGHHCFISKNVTIGNNVTIMHNITIDGKVSIGDNTFIESGTVIGACGFGYYKDFSGNQEIVPHYGGVQIGANVRIGANNTIIRGCLSDTIIEDYVKTADLCCISHNDVIKQGAMLTCGTIIAGSTIVGEHAWLAPGTILNNAAVIGDNSYVGIGSVVLKKVKNGQKVFGNPAVNID